MIDILNLWSKRNVRHDRLTHTSRVSESISRKAISAVSEDASGLERLSGVFVAIDETGRLFGWQSNCWGYMGLVVPTVCGLVVSFCSFCWSQV